MKISPNTARRIEEGMVETFRRYAYDTTSLASDASLWEWLALAQHHGLPTRLLDWSKSPYLALHFATYKASLMTRDSVIWVIDPLRFSNEFAVFREYNQWRQDVASVAAAASCRPASWTPSTNGKPRWTSTCRCPKISSPSSSSSRPRCRRVSSTSGAASS